MMRSPETEGDERANEAEIAAVYRRECAMLGIEAALSADPERARSLRLAQWQLRGLAAAIERSMRHQPPMSEEAPQ